MTLLTIAGIIVVAGVVSWIIYCLITGKTATLKYAFAALGGSVLFLVLSFLRTISDKEKTAEQDIGKTQANDAQRQDMAGKADAQVSKNQALIDEISAFLNKK